MSHNYRSLASLFGSLTLLFVISLAAVPPSHGARAMVPPAPPRPVAGGSWTTKGTMKGIVWKTGVYTGALYGNQTVNVIDINLALVKLRPVRAASNTKYESVLSMGKRTSALAGVNGGFFCNTSDDICAPCGENPPCPHDTVLPHSLLIIEGQVKSTSCSTRTAFGLTLKGVPLIRQVPAGKGWPVTAYAVGAGPNLVTQYIKNVTQEGFCWYDEQAARTAIATVGNGHVLLITVDEGYPAATGMTVDTLADFLVAELHVQSAMNLDGGGSTTMYYNGAIVNKPSDTSCDGCCRCVYDGMFVLGK